MLTKKSNVKDFVKICPFSAFFFKIIWKCEIFALSLQCEKKTSILTKKNKKK